MRIKDFLFVVLVTSGTGVFAQDMKFVVVGIENGDTIYAQMPEVKDGSCIHYRYVEHMPVPAVDIDSFIRTSLQYPADAINKKVQGRVLVGFTIDDKGNVVNIHLDRPIYPSLDKAAMRIIQNLPAWKPGSEKGKNIPLEFSLPVVFKL